MENGCLDNRDHEKILEFLDSMPCDSENFVEDILRNLSSIFSFAHITFLRTDGSERYGDITGYRIRSQSMQQYNAYYYTTDIFLPQNYSGPSRFRPKTVATYTDMMSDSSYENTEFYRDFLRRENFYHEAAVYLRRGGRFIGSMGVFRDKDSGRFTQKELTILETLTPFLSNGFYMHQKFCRFRRENQLYQKSLSGMPLGIILLDSRFSVVFHNRTAMEYGLEIQQSRHHTADPIQNAVQLALSNFRQPGRDPTAPLVLGGYRFFICPVAFPAGMRDVSEYYLLYIQDIRGWEPASYPSSTHRSPCRLTKREGEVVMLIAQGLSNKQIAVRLHISSNTVRTHVENILVKLGASNRTEILKNLGIVRI